MKVVYAIIAIILVVLISISFPLLTIWSLNTLFKLNIEYSISTWFAIVWLIGITFGSISGVLRKKD